MDNNWGDTKWWKRVALSNIGREIKIPTTRTIDDLWNEDIDPDLVKPTKPVRDDFNGYPSPITDWFIWLSYRYYISEYRIIRFGIRLILKGQRLWRKYGR